VTPRLLIDAIVQQTTVLIAQLSTAAGLRSPLAHVADQVFLSLAQEIERQGVSRKVVADMFGLALRTYQRKVQRLEESHSASGRTLWEGILEYITEHAPVRRESVLARFRNDEELAVVAVINDLVMSGLVYSSGRGDTAVYGITSDADRKALSRDDAVDALALLLWGRIFRSPGISTAALIATTRAEEIDLRGALERLLADGRVTRDGDSDEAALHSAAFVIPVGAPQGWEAAVFDHYQALANGVSANLQLRAKGVPPNDLVGGTTLHFGIHPGHPFEAQVLGTLRRVRAELHAFWDEVAAYNREHPIADEAATRVTFYFGQSVTLPSDSDPDAFFATKETQGEQVNENS
jgi:hypothetical protein